MNRKTALVITSISEPNDVLRTFAEGCKKHGVEFILIGDTKSPADFQLDGCRFVSIPQQGMLSFKYVETCPHAHYARKNIGYLLAARNGAEMIVESDDDNFPRELFWLDRKIKEYAHALHDESWVNIYAYFSDTGIWPRGFPLGQLEKGVPDLDRKYEEMVHCPIQQGLADENPDVDAIFRLTRKLPLNFSGYKNIAVGKKSWCPFNSQNTTFFKEAFLLTYLPAYCSFRMTDIWRSFVAQRICWENDWHVLFHRATVWQERNYHNLMRDFEDEIPGYLNNENIARNFEELELKPGKQNIATNLISCYEKLVEMQLVGEKEIPLLKAWIDDMQPFLK